MTQNCLPCLVTASQNSLLYGSPGKQGSTCRACVNLFAFSALFWVVVIACAEVFGWFLALGVLQHCCLSPLLHLQSHSSQMPAMPRHYFALTAPAVRVTFSFRTLRHELEKQ